MSRMQSYAQVREKCGPRSGCDGTFIHAKLKPLCKLCSLYRYQQASGARDNSSNHHNHNNNSDYSKKEEFRRYLEQTGVLDALTKVLVGLYEEPDRPQQPVDYIKRYIGAPANVDVEGLKRENEQLRAEVEKLRKQVNGGKG